MRGDKGKNQKGFSTMNLVLEAVSAADREAAEANQSRYLYNMGVLKHDQGAEVSSTDVDKHAAAQFVFVFRR